MTSCSLWATQLEDRIEHTAANIPLLPPVLVVVQHLPIGLEMANPNLICLLVIGWKPSGI